MTWWVVGLCPCFERSATICTNFINWQANTVTWILSVYRGMFSRLWNLNRFNNIKYIIPHLNERDIAKSGFYGFVSQEICVPSGGYWATTNTTTLWLTCKKFTYLRGWLQFIRDLFFLPEWLYYHPLTQSSRECIGSYCWKRETCECRSVVYKSCSCIASANYLYYTWIALVNDVRKRETSCTRSFSRVTSHCKWGG